MSLKGIMICYALLAFGTLLAFPVAGVTSMIVFVVVRGFAHGGVIVDYPVITRHCYGRENLGLNMGIFGAFLQLGFAVGVPALGWSYDYFGSYSNGFIVAALCAVMAAVMLLPVRPRFWSPPAARPQETSMDLPREAGRT